MTLYMYDDINADLIPSDAEVVAYYVDGLYKNLGAVQARCPHAALVSIAVFASDDAEAADVETGDMTVAEIYDWLTRQLARGLNRPAIYTSVNNINKMMLTMNANGFKRDQYRIWSAHYGAGVHVCGPRTCGLTNTAADWTQYTDTALGKSLDESTLGTDNADFSKPEPPSNWTYGPPTSLKATPGHTSVRLTFGAPTGAPVKPAEYQIYIYKGTDPTFKTLVDSYPRITSASPWQGGSLSTRTTYTAHVVAAGPDGARVRPYTYASVQFTTGG